MRLFLLAIASVMLPVIGIAAPKSPTNGMIKVAFAISDHVNVMDVAGPWEVFADTSMIDVHGKEISPYETYTVAASTTPLHSAGANHPGLAITPDYSFANAPTPDIVVIPAQHGSPELEAWLKQLHARHVTIMSVCTGAFKLAQAGLLDGKKATTHHWYFGNFARKFPDIRLVKEVRYVQADPITFTAGGLTSGIDLALHLVAIRFGQEVARQTANFIEYMGTGWKTDRGIAPLDLPITRQDWTGTLAGNMQVILHIVTHGASPAMTVDIPNQHIHGATATPVPGSKSVHLAVAIPGHPATIIGSINANGDTLTGTFTRDGHTQALVLHAGSKSREPHTRR